MLRRQAVLLTSRDRGHTWQRTGSLPAMTGSGVAFANRRNGWAGLFS